MMPRFRVWDEENKRFLDAEEFIIMPDGRVLVGDWMTGNDFSYGYDEQDRFILTQSTGLKDKNAVEIYEGDMVKIDQRAPYDSHIPNDSVNEIVYKDSAFCVKEIRNVVDIEWPIIAGLYYIVDEEFEVIGNIYENPELLEAVK